MSSFFALRSAAFLFGAFATLAFVPSCSNTPAGDPPQVFVISKVIRSADSTKVCQSEADPWINVGGVAKGESAKNGEAYKGAPVTVECSVVAKSDGFEVNANMFVDGPTGGSIIISGKMKGPGADKNNVESGIRAVFNRRDFGRFEQSDCQVNYELSKTDLTRKEMNVASGRAWGEVVCPGLVKDVGKSSERTCAGRAEFRFENCAQ